MGKVYFTLSLFALVAACGASEPSEDANAPVAAIEAKATPVAVATSAPTETPTPTASEKPKSILGQWLSADSTCKKVADHINIDRKGIGMIEGGCRAGKPISGDSYKGTMTCSESGEEWEIQALLRLKPNGNLLYSEDGGEPMEYKRCSMEMNYGY
jgi:hypothetical protein